MKNNRNIIEVVTVCIYHSDKFKYCLNNRKYFDRWLIVTVPEDKDTIEICKLFSIEYCFTSRVYARGAFFAKGRAINDGLALLKKSGWLLQLDCDIILPENIRQLIESIPLNKKNISSLFSVKARRVIGVDPEFQSTKDYDVYQNFHQIYRERTHRSKSYQPLSEKNYLKLKRKNGVTEKAGSIKNQWNSFTKNNWSNLIYPFEGSQVYHLGYFQLFHSENLRSYPETSKDANHDDISFRESFSISRRQFIDCECVHLGLICAGRNYFHYLDRYVSLIKSDEKYAYLNKLHRLKIKRGSTLSYNQKFKLSIDGVPGCYLISTLSSPMRRKVPGLDWMIWGHLTPYYQKNCSKINM